MNRFLLYGHGGAYNHGAEAIIKCTAQLIRKTHPDSKIILSTHFKEQDIQFQMPVDLYCERDLHYLDLDKQSETKGRYDSYIYKPTLDQITSDTICLSVGGDNYCYDNWRKWKVIHETALERGASSVLWSCSIEPSMLCDEMVDTLRSHHLITARESLTYAALKSKGLQNVVQCADVAFLLSPQKCRLPDHFIPGNTVAINISPLIVRREKSAGVILQNIKTLIAFLLESTDMNIVLIPHVLISVDNDLDILKTIFHALPDQERISFVSENLSAAEYKFIIGNCRFGVFARTHASIAAYSSCVPSIVIGYSVKSKGIATDLDVEDYVLPIQNMQGPDCLLTTFQRLMKHEHAIKQGLSEKIPQYSAKASVETFAGM